MEEVKVVGGGWLSPSSTTDIQTAYSFRLLSASSSSCRLLSGAEGPFDYSHAHFELSVTRSVGVGVVVNKTAE